MTQESSEDLEKHAIPGHRARGNSEYVRLAISDEPRAAETEILHPQAESRTKAYWWWMKAFLWCFVIVVLSLVLVKWGVPFVFEKVLPRTLHYTYSSTSDCNCFLYVASLRIWGLQFLFRNQPIQCRLAVMNLFDI